MLPALTFTLATLLPAPAPVHQNAVHLSAEAWSTPTVTRVHVQTTTPPGIGVHPDAPGDPLWLNVLRNLARLNPAVTAGVTVACAADGATHTVRTNGAGHAACTLPAGAKRVTVTAAGANTLDLPVDALPAAPLVVVSDLDDTIFVTGMADGTAVRRVLGTNAVTREVFADAPGLYREFAARGLPVVYLSNGPFGALADRAATLNLHGFPPGPLLLRELDWPALFDRSGHKRERLAGLARDLPGSRFILIGDTGQHDPEIYAAFARTHPGRVAAIYVRDVTGPERHAQVQELLAGARADGVPAVVSTDGRDFGRHARELR